MNSPHVVDFYSDEGWEATVNDALAPMSMYEDYSIMDKLMDEAVSE